MIHNDSCNIHKEKKKNNRNHKKLIAKFKDVGKFGKDPGENLANTEHQHKNPETIEAMRWICVHN